jgi:deazaflavin-dependent oxidoreductase (nitroreductase family)
MKEGRRTVSQAESTNDDAVSATHAWNATIIEEFRANDGKLGGQFEGAPMLLLTTTGAKTHEERVNPMMYLIDEGRLFVFASKAGADTNPDWFHNLVADPSVTVEMGSEKFKATASPLSGEERDRVYAVQAGRFPGFAEYQEKTSRIIPVVELFRA